jgi:hypothetical protein
LGQCRKRGKNGVAIRAGVDIIHINTEGRLAWKQGLEAGLRGSVGDNVLYHSSFGFGKQREVRAPQLK